MSKKFQNAIDKYEREFEEAAPVWLMQEEDAVVALDSAVDSGQPIRTPRVPDEMLT